MGVSGGLVKDGTMYQIDRDTNNILRVTERRFSDLGLRERENLQEWIAKNPDVLGEDLLIIQKEFDGFSDTNEQVGRHRSRCCLAGAQIRLLLLDIVYIPNSKDVPKISFLNWE